MLREKVNFFKIFLTLFGILLLLTIGYFLINIVKSSQFWESQREQLLEDEFTPGMTTITFNQMPIRLILLSLLNPWLWVGSIAILSFFMCLSFATFKQETRMLKKISITILVLIFISTILLSTSFIVLDQQIDKTPKPEGWQLVISKIKEIIINSVKK
ncbi:hypothetical protein [Spiroplasma endosymbiont of Panorpa germanica]|uniref:hypothetical protein n=1 Tax=Spiroplasma endosymbiont of Panorpa germanica TaxID=3066314 RepID=UPI0030D467A0